MSSLVFRMGEEGEGARRGRVSIEVDHNQYELLEELKHMGGNLAKKALVPEFWARLQNAVYELFTELPIPTEGSLQFIESAIIYGNKRFFEIDKEGPDLWNLDMPSAEEVFMGQEILDLIENDPRVAAREFVSRMFEYSLSLRSTLRGRVPSISIFRGLELGNDDITDVTDKLAQIHYALELREEMPEARQGALSFQFDIGFPDVSGVALDKWLRGFYLLREPQYFLELSTVVHSLWNELFDASSSLNVFHNAAVKLHMLLARINNLVVDQLNGYSQVTDGKISIIDKADGGLEGGRMLGLLLKI